MDASPERYGSLPAPGGLGRILVVDDHGTTLALIESVLELGGFQVRAVKSGQAALEQFPVYDPDLVILDVFMPGMDGLEVCRRLRATGKGKEVPILFLTADASRETQLAAIAAGGDDLIHKPSFHSELLIRVRSLLRIRRLQADLRWERDQLQETQKQREMLQHFLVHDLRSMLQTVLCSTELIAETAVGLPGTHAARILESVQTMDRMTQDLLDIAKCESGTLKVETSRILLEPTLRKWIEEIRPLFERKAQKILVEVPLDLVVAGDPELLRRSFLNLLGNSAKYGSKGSETIVKAMVLSDGVRIQIQDQGPGIPEEMREKVFDPFVRLARDSEQARASSGLGLAFCRAVAQVHGGRIWVEPNEPRGAVFCLELPEVIAQR